MSREYLKVSRGFGKGVKLTSFIRVHSWIGMILSSVVLIFALNILVLPSALNLTIQELIGKMSFYIALVIFPIGLDSEFRTIDTTPVVYAVMTALALASIGWFIFSFYLRKVNSNCKDWKNVEDFLNKSLTVIIFIFNVLNLASIAVSETLNIDWLVNKTLTSSTNVTSIVWITLSIINAIFSSILVYGIRRRKAYLIKVYLQWANALFVICLVAILFFSCLFALVFKELWIVFLAIPFINISVFLFVHYVGNVVIIYSIIFQERTENTSEMRESVSVLPHLSSPDAQYGRDYRGRRIRNAIRIVDDSSNDSEVVAEIARTIDSFS